MNEGILTWIDYRPAIAHNKVMILDNKIVLTGSFNYLKGAQKKNAENLLVITDSNVTTCYYENW